MTFEQLTNELDGARNAGYTWDLTANRETDTALLEKLRKERGTRWVENLLDSFWDFDGDLFKGGDGNFYAVKMVFCGDHSVPAIWHRLVKKD